PISPERAGIRERPMLPDMPVPKMRMPVIIHHGHAETQKKCVCWRVAASWLIQESGETGLRRRAACRLA
ncbi:MAG: hypothetical protein L0Z53_09405, partial [Acidobacteriales bacterium]|nr:hypothetical protein [Terriglobales bacterium]